MKTKALKFILPLFLLICSINMSAQVYRQVFTGTVAGKKVRVELYVNSYNYSVSGSYYYNTYKKNISLSGSCNPAGPARNMYYLSEYSGGNYSGSWTVNYNTSNGRMTGTMTNRRGNTYKVNLRAL